MLIEETTFTTCKTSDTFGGGIFFRNSNSGECVIFHTCDFNCSSTSTNKNGASGQYAFIETKNAASSKNEVNEATITGTKKESVRPEFALYLAYGNILCSSVNLTNNECYYLPALCCYPSDDTSTFTCCIIYTSIVNNTAKEGCGCIYLANEESTHLISTSNINNNKQNISGEGTIETYANLFINESCIIGNNEGGYVFYEVSTSCNIKITNCTLDSDIITSSERCIGSITIIDSKEYSFINALSHIVTEKCDSFFDSYGTLTAAVKIQKKRMRNNISCKGKKSNDMLLTFLQFLCTMTLLPSLSAKRVPYIGIGSE